MLVYADRMRGHAMRVMRVLPARPQVNEIFAGTAPRGRLSPYTHTQCFCFFHFRTCTVTSYILAYKYVCVLLEPRSHRRRGEPVLCLCLHSRIRGPRSHRQGGEPLYACLDEHAKKAYRRILLCSSQIALGISGLLDIPRHHGFGTNCHISGLPFSELPCWRPW